MRKFIQIGFLYLLGLFSSTEMYSQLTFQEARDTVISDVIMFSTDTQLVAFGYPNLLVLGDTVWSSDDDSSAMAITDSTWFFWVDDYKAAFFAHPTRFVYVDRQTGTIEVKNWNWWPMINRVPIWSTNSERFNSTDNIYGNPLIEPTTTNSNPPGNIQGGKNQYNRVYLYMVSGGDDDLEKVIKADMDNVENATKQYFGEENIVQIKRRPKVTMQQLCNDLDDLEDSSPPCDKIIFYYVGHGEKDRLILTAHAEGSDNRHLTAQELTTKLEALDSKLWILLETCQGGSFEDDFQDANIDGHAIFSASADEYATIDPPNGSNWTTYFTECMNNDSADGNDPGKDISPQEAQDWAENRLDSSMDQDQIDQDSYMIPLSDTTAPAFEFFNLSTGWDAINQSVFPFGVRDPNWKQVYEPSQSITPTDVHVIAPNSSYWNPAPLGSQWVSNSFQGATTSTAGWHEYKREFYLNVVDSCLYLDIRYMVDDTGTVLLNGVTLIDHEKDFINPILDTVVGPNNFVVGLNVLETRIWNDIGPHGFAMKAFLTAKAGTVDPLVSSAESQTPSPIFGNVVVYPNPANNRLTVSGLPPNTKAEFKIYGVHGQELISTNSTEIDLDMLPKGFYFLRIQHKKGEMVIRFSKI